jgi:hypothetical protein
VLPLERTISEYCLAKLCFCIVKLSSQNSYVGKLFTTRDNCHGVETVNLFIFGHLSVSCRLLVNVTPVKKSPAVARLSMRQYLLHSQYTFMSYKHHHHHDHHHQQQQQQRRMYACTQSVSFNMSSDQVHKQW